MNNTIGLSAKSVQLVAKFKKAINNTQLKDAPKDAFGLQQNYERATLSSYLRVCIDSGEVDRAAKFLSVRCGPKKRQVIEVQHFNIVIQGLAERGMLSSIMRLRVLMLALKMEPNSATFASIILAYAKNKCSAKDVENLFTQMKMRNVEPEKIFHHTYLGREQRNIVSQFIMQSKPGYVDVFPPLSTDYKCDLLRGLKKSPSTPNDFAAGVNLDRINTWAEHQRSLEAKSSVMIKSVARINISKEKRLAFAKRWPEFMKMWRESIAKSLDNHLEVLRRQFLTTDKVHLYPYLSVVDKTELVELMLDEVELNSSFTNHSNSTQNLHYEFGRKVMLRYLRAKSINDTSYMEVQNIYEDYLENYCTNPDLMGKMNPRQYMQARALKTRNYAVLRDQIGPMEGWPYHVNLALGKFLYRIILKEVKWDPDVVRDPQREIKQANLVSAFYTAYFQLSPNSHKIKEEFRSHEDFEKLKRIACAGRIRFNYSFLPSLSPPMPWLSYNLGGYLTTRSDLVRVSGPLNEHSSAVGQQGYSKIQKLYPSFDSLNALSLCPWIVNKEVLDIVIQIFNSGGNKDLNVPLDTMKMKESAPVLDPFATKADQVMYMREKKKFDQKVSEMYSLWSDCLYRLSIANHYKDKVFWLPHNMDFRGRTYPIPPHFNHLGADLARSLLLFAKGVPLGERGLNWLKIHVINLVGKMKHSTLQERLDYANSILHVDILDSADNPLDGRRWWTQNENPWQVLACCKEIAKAIRSLNHRNYVSHYPVHQDGSCNGLQHYAALGRDLDGGKAVNLVPSERPQDVYSRVVDLVEKSRQADAETGLESAKKLEGFVQRKVIKQTVMTTVYGVTRYGARNQIARQLAAKGFPDTLVWPSASYLTGLTFNSIGQMFYQSRLIQDWFVNCAQIISSSYHRPVSWETPLGFRVTQPYTEATKTGNSSNIFSTAFLLDSPNHSAPDNKPNPSKQKNAFPPNYIHSLDSAHMMLTSLHCQQRGLTYVSVHDCYWTHAATVDAMNRVCREQFVELHSQPLLEDLSKQFIEVKPDPQVILSNSPSTSEAVRSSESAQQRKKPKLVLSTNNTSPVEVEVKTMSKADRHRWESSELALKTFSAIPPKGQLDLKVVVDSVYFFS